MKTDGFLKKDPRSQLDVTDAMTPGMMSNESQSPDHAFHGFRVGDDVYIKNF